MKTIKRKQTYYHPDERSGICVVTRQGESFDSLMKRFKKKYSKSGISRELRERMYYEKPSNKKRRKKMQSIRLLQREEEKAEQNRIKIQKIRQKQKKKRSKENDQSDKRQSSSNTHDKK